MTMYLLILLCLLGLWKISQIGLLGCITLKM